MHIKYIGHLSSPLFWLPSELILFQINRWWNRADSIFIKGGSCLENLTTHCFWAKWICYHCTPSGEHVYLSWRLLEITLLILHVILCFTDNWVSLHSQSDRCSVGVILAAPNVQRNSCMFCDKTDAEGYLRSWIVDFVSFTYNNPKPCTPKD